MLCIRFKFKVKLGLVKPGLRLKPGLTKPVFVHMGLSNKCVYRINERNRKEKLSLTLFNLIRKVKKTFVLN